MRKLGPYTSLAIRTFLSIGSLALVACATSSPVPQLELTELKAEIRAIREENTRLESRLERIEARASVGPRPSAHVSPIPEPLPEAVPPLTVVKLKPRQHPAPKISTGVSIVEPDPEVLNALKRTGGAQSEEVLDPAIGEAFFQQGVSALKTGNVVGGILELKKFATESPDHPRADNAIYFSGLGLMGLNDFDAAAQAFEEVVARYPAGDAVLDSLLKLAECRVRLNRSAEARVVYQKIVSSYPGTTAASAAQARLATLTGSP